MQAAGWSSPAVGGVTLVSKLGNRRMDTSVTPHLPEKNIHGGSNGSVVATPHDYLGSPVFMTYKAKIGDANGAGVSQLCPKLVTEEWTQV